MRARERLAFDPEWRIAWLAYGLTDQEAKRLLGELRARYLTDYDVACLLGVPAKTVQHWLTGKRRLDRAVRRAIWLTWCLVLHPEVLKTQFDLVTWGRFRVIRRKKPRAVSLKSCSLDHWSI